MDTNDLDQNRFVRKLDFLQLKLSLFVSGNSDYSPFALVGLKTCIQFYCFWPI